jgi:WD40 repeat protein
MASGSDDKTIRLWDVKAGRPVHTFSGHAGLVTSIAFSSDGKIIASSSSDKTIRLWDVPTRKLVHTFEGHGGRVNSISISAVGGLVASGSTDKTVRLWDMKAGKLLHTFAGHADGVNSVAFNPTGTLMASGADDKTVRLWDVQARKPIHTFIGHAGRVISVAFSPTGAMIATASDDATVRVWDVKTKTVLQIQVAGKHANWLSIDRQKIVCRGDDGTMLKNRSIKNDRWLPVQTADSGRPDTCSISVVPGHVTLTRGESKDLRVRVTNSGPHPAYWLNLKPLADRGQAIRFDPPDHMFKGKGEQIWRPERIARLEPGETATLYARIRLNFNLPTTSIKPGMHRFALTVACADNTEISQTIIVAVQSSDL